MKKIALLLVIAILGGAAVAAPATKAVVKDVSVSQSASAQENQSGLTAVALTTLGMPLVKLGMGSWSLDLGATIASPAAGTTNYVVVVKGDLPLGKFAQVRTYWAPQLTLSSIGGASTITGALSVGGEYLFAPQLAVFGDLALISITSAAGATTWSLGTNGVLCYSGIRVYM